MDTLVVVLIVGLAAVFIARSFYRKVKRGREPEGGCACGCTACDSAPECEGDRGQHAGS